MWSMNMTSIANPLRTSMLAILCMGRLGWNMFLNPVSDNLSMAEALRQREQSAQNLADQIEDLRNSAKGSFELGNLNESKRFLSELIRINPKDAEALFNRGIVNERLMKNSEAMADYTDAIKADPGFHKSYVNRGILLASVGKYKEAVQDFNQALRIDPNSSETYMNLGTT